MNPKRIKNLDKSTIADEIKVINAEIKREKDKYCREKKKIIKEYAIANNVDPKVVCVPANESNWQKWEYDAYAYLIDLEFGSNNYIFNPLYAKKVVLQLFYYDIAKPKQELHQCDIGEKLSTVKDGKKILETVAELYRAFLVAGAPHYLSKELRNYGIKFYDRVLWAKLFKKWCSISAFLDRSIEKNRCNTKKYEKNEERLTKLGEEMKRFKTKFNEEFASKVLSYI